MRRAAVRSALASLVEEPAARLLAGIGVSPNAVTVAGLLVAGASAYLASVGMLLAAGVVLLASGVVDLLDGALARRLGRVTRFGGLLDSVVDRLAEMGLLLGVLVFFAVRSDTVGVVLSYLALGTSFMVSYVRARAGGLRVDCKEGLMTRPERVAALGVALIVAQWWLPALSIALGVVAGLSLATSAQRVMHAWRELRGQR